MVGWKELRDYLKEASPRDVNAWEIQRRFGMTKGASRQALWRLANVRKQAVQTKRGFYAHTSSLARIRNPLEDFLLIGFHAITANADCHEQVGGGFRRIQQLVTTRYDAKGRNPANLSEVFKGDWDGRALTVQLTTRRKVQVHLRASVAPLDALDFSAFLRYLSAFYPIPESRWLLSFEMNEDVEARLTVGPFSWGEAHAWARVYWKEAIRRTRIEVGRSRLPLERVREGMDRVITALMQVEAP